jgi:hypothetical protein
LQDFTLPSVASKNGGAVHPFSQKPWPIPQTSKKNIQKNIKILKKGLSAPYPSRRPTASCGSTPRQGVDSPFI